jgi:hypothetical protein
MEQEGIRQTDRGMKSVIFSGLERSRPEKITIHPNGLRCRPRAPESSWLGFSHWRMLRSMFRRATPFVACWLLPATACGGGRGSSSDPSRPCAFSITQNELSSTIPTVGIVDWSLADETPTSAKIVYALEGASSALLNRGGEAPVELHGPSHRTLLLGLKQASRYTFHVEATLGERTCVSETFELPTTGTFEAARTVGVEVLQPEKREPGFIVTSSGTSLPSSAFIIDADGDLVWYFPGPQNLTRAQMDYEGENLWMLELNLTNEVGEMRSVSMDGAREERDVSGLEKAHHDFTVMPGGRVAAISWAAPGIDPVSELVIRSPDGSITKPFLIGDNLYGSDSFHANSIHYVPFDDSFTIADRNPNVFVKVSATGSVEWQLGGHCDGAPAGDRCVPGAWEVTHGHHLLEDGTFVGFNNTYTGRAHVLEFALDATPSSFSAELITDYAGDAASTNLGDVQRLPGGNTLVSYATDGKLVELDSSWNVVQTFTVRAGYTSWRRTLYGPPPRP